MLRKVAILHANRQRNGDSHDAGHVATQEAGAGRGVILPAPASFRLLLTRDQSAGTG